MKQNIILGLLLTTLTACGGASFHDQIDRDKWKDEKDYGTIGVPVNNSLIIFAIDGVQGPNESPYPDFPNNYTDSFTQSTSINVNTGKRKVTLGCRYLEPRNIFGASSSAYTERTITVNVKRGEVITLQWQEQLDLGAQGKDPHRIDTSSCSILVKSDSGKKTLLRDEGDDDLASAADE